MKFEDLQGIWTSQMEEPIYAINTDGLHTVLRQKSLKLKRLIFWQELQTYASSLFVICVIGALFIAYFSGSIDRLASGWEMLALLLAASGWIYFSGVVFLSRRQQRARLR